MPVLPLIDLMLLAGWTSLAIGFVLKAVAVLSHWKPTIFSLSPIDFLLVALAAFMFAIALAARTWVAQQQPAVSARRRKEETLRAYRALHQTDVGAEVGAERDAHATASQPDPEEAPLADPAHRTG